MVALSLLTGHLVNPHVLLSHWVSLPLLLPQEIQAVQVGLGEGKRGCSFEAGYVLGFGSLLSVIRIVLFPRFLILPS